jgi:hypothetical protein
MNEIIENETDKEKIIRLEKALQYANEKLSYFENNAISKLYYSLNRTANQLADILNSKDLRTVPLDDPKDKTFDRLKIIWNDSSSLAEAIKALGSLAGINEEDKKNTAPKSFLDSLAEKRN